MKQNHKYLHIIIYLTYECNLRCSYCVITFEKIRLEDVLVADIDHFIKENRDAFETIFIEFIGGEPLLQRRQIDLFMTALSGKNIEFQITTNGTLLTSEIYKNTLSKMDHINLSYNENYFNNQKLFHQISTIIENKRNVDINFIYDPRKERSIIEENFLFVLKNGYRNINILPIVLIHEYSEADFANLIRFITMVMTYKNNINLTFLYYIQEKNNHFEFTIDPHGNVLGDNMGTAETFF